MTIEPITGDFTVCRTADAAGIDFGAEYCFFSKTDEEFSPVCRTADVPENVLLREDGWAGFRIAGVLDFSLTGILAGIASLLAEEKIGIFAVSTYNTDYIFVKRENLPRALSALSRNGYTVRATV